MVLSLPIWFMQTFRFEDLLFSLENIGLFQFILPFLLIFAVIFGVLSWTNMFGGNKGVHVIIAVVIGLLAIRWSVYTDFLNIISPKLGVGLVIILVLVLLMGLFIPADSQAIMGWVMMAVGVVIAIVIFAQTYSDFGYGGYVTSDLIGWVVITALLIGILVVIVLGNNSSKPSTSKKLGRLWDSIVEGK